MSDVGTASQAAARPIGLLLVDDHPAVLSGLADLFEAEPGIEVLATAERRDQALDIARRVKPEAAIVDFHMANENGLDLALALNFLTPPPHVVIYSAYPGPALVAAACVAGACGVIAKHGLVHELPDALRAARLGRRTMPTLSRTDLSTLAERLHPQDAPLLWMLWRGLDTTEIAASTGIDEAELQRRRRRMIHALTDRSHAALSAMRGSALHYSRRQGSG